MAAALKMRDFPEAGKPRYRSLSPVVKSFDPKGPMIIEGIANLAKPDRWGEVCVPDGWDLENYKKNPIILLEHDRSRPIGRCIMVEARSDGLYYQAEIGDPGKAPLTPDQEYARSLLAQGILKTNSVGFLPHLIEYDEDKDELRYTDSELLEISVVAIPMQQDSLITSVKNWRTKMSGEANEKKEYSTKEIMDSIKSLAADHKDCHAMVKDIHAGKHPGQPPASDSGSDGDTDDKALKAAQAEVVKLTADLKKATDDLAAEKAAIAAYRTKSESFIAELRKQGKIK